ncbi:MAG: MarR family transcriptional regulator [Cyclobacteriaceae bacterium]|nr:MarR family transcriptional regulator [Cyclobacteriaceae bacterium]
MKREETIDHHMKASWHAISRMYNQQAVKHDITTSIGFVLLNIHSDHGTPATKIAPMMGLESRSLTRMLKSMEEKGLIYKQADLEDKRSVRIFLTSVGVEKKEIARLTVLKFNTIARERIDKKKLAVFFEVVNEINEIIDQGKVYESED